MKMADKSEFKYPLTDLEVVGVHYISENEFDRATLLLMDANRRLFSITISTSEDYEQLLSEEPSDPDSPEQPEPVFVVPDKSLDYVTITDVLSSPPHLLAKYLIAQDQEAEDIAN